MNVELLEAIKTKYDSAKAALVAVGLPDGNFFCMKAPAASTFPRLVITVPDDSVDPRFNADNETTVVDFAVFDNNPDSPKRALQILGVVKAQFSDARLTVSGRTCFSAQRLGDALFPAEDDGNIIGFDAHTRIEYKTG